MSLTMTGFVIKCAKTNLFLTNIYKGVDFSTTKPYVFPTFDEAASILEAIKDEIPDNLELYIYFINFDIFMYQRMEEVGNG